MVEADEHAGGRARARHQRLAEELATQILRGVFKIGDLLPTEAELCATHGIARGTARQALERLQQLGMITRRRGVGSVVIADRPSEPYRAVAADTGDVRSFVTSTRLVETSSRFVTATAPLARSIDVPRGSEWFLVEGVRVPHGSDDPVCWSIQYLRSGKDRRIVPDFGVLVDPSYRIEQIVSADVLSPGIAAALRAEPGAPALHVTRRISDPRGTAVSIGIHIHRADRHRVVTVVQAGGPEQRTATRANDEEPAR